MNHGEKPLSIRCQMCGGPLYRNNASGFCQRCSRKLVCKICDRVHADTKAHQCIECRKALAGMAAVARLAVVRPDPVTIAERIAIYTDQAERKVPLSAWGKS